MKLHAYLTFDGDCEAAFAFYRTVFGGEFIAQSRYRDLPEGQGFEVADADLSKIMHISLQIDENTLLMGCDVASTGAIPWQAGTNFSLSVNLTDKAEAIRIFKALSDEVTMPMTETFWGSYFGQLVDRFGVQWMVNCDLGRGSNQN